MRLIGITGSIACGKSTVSRELVRRGWPVIDGDALSRELTAPGGRAMKDIRFDRCISSPLCRAWETAEILLRESGNETEIETDDRIREMNCGDIEEKNIAVMGEEAAMLFFKDPFRFPGVKYQSCLIVLRKGGNTSDEARI